MYKYKIGKQILTIERDSFTNDTPREWGNLGKMLCFHDKYYLGDKNLNYNIDDFESWEDIIKAIIKNEDALIILPLYLYDHSGLSIKIGSYKDLLPQGHYEFDSGQVGFIYATKEDIQNTYKSTNKETLKEVKKQLKREVDIYNDYLEGNIWQFSIIKEKKCKECGHISEEYIDGCGGFYGDDLKENGMLSHIDKKWHKLIRKDL